MSVVLTRFDWNTGQDVPFKVSDDAVGAFVNWILNSRSWRTDDNEYNMEVIDKKVRKLRTDAFRAQPEAAPKRAPKKSS